MADEQKLLISKININNKTYEIKDTVARDAMANLSGAMHFVGVSTTDPTAAGGPTITGVTTFKSGDTCVYTPTGKEQCEYVYNGTTWSELGSTSKLGSLASKSSASGTLAKHSHTISEQAAATATVTQGTVSASGTYTPAGAVKAGGSTSYTPAGTVTHTVKSTDKVLGEATTFTAAESDVTFGQHTTESVLKSDVTATVPGYAISGTASADTKYISATVPAYTINSAGGVTTTKKYISATVPAYSIDSTGGVSKTSKYISGTVPTYTVSGGTTSDNYKYLSASASGTAINAPTNSVTLEDAAASTKVDVTENTTLCSASVDEDNEILNFTPVTLTQNSAPSLGGTTTFVTSASVSTQPTITLTSNSATATGRIKYTETTSSTAASIAEATDVTKPVTFALGTTTSTGAVSVVTNVTHTAASIKSEGTNTVTFALADATSAGAVQVATDASHTAASIKTSGTNTVTFALNDATSTGAVQIATGVSSSGLQLTESGTKSVTFATTGHTVDAITALGAATAAAQDITVGTNDKVTAITGMNTPSFAGEAVDLTFEGTEATVSVEGNTAGVAVTVPAHNHGGSTGELAAQTITVS